MGQNSNFLKQMPKRQRFWETQIRLRRGTANKIFDNFHTSFEKFGAIGNLTGVNIVRLAWIFCKETPKIAKKTPFILHLGNYLSLRYWYPYLGYHHVKAHVPRITKMWWFLGVGLFKGELLLLKVNWLWNFGSVRGVTKKPLLFRRLLKFSNFSLENEIYSFRPLGAPVRKSCRERIAFFSKGLASQRNSKTNFHFFW